jgi:hypothetical protein
MTVEMDFMRLLQVSWLLRCMVFVAAAPNRDCVVFSRLRVMKKIIFEFVHKRHMTEQSDLAS